MSDCEITEGKKKTNKPLSQEKKRKKNTHSIFSSLSFSFSVVSLFSLGMPFLSYKYPVALLNLRECLLELHECLQAFRKSEEDLFAVMMEFKKKQTEIPTFLPAALPPPFKEKAAPLGISLSGNPVSGGTAATHSATPPSQTQTLRLVPPQEPIAGDEHDLFVYRLKMEEYKQNLRKLQLSTPPATAVASGAASSSSSSSSSPSDSSATPAPPPSSTGSPSTTMSPPVTSILSPPIPQLPAVTPAPPGTKLVYSPKRFFLTKGYSVTDEQLEVVRQAFVTEGGMSEQSNLNDLAGTIIVVVLNSALKENVSWFYKGVKDTAFFLDLMRTEVIPKVGSVPVVIVWLQQPGGFFYSFVKAGKNEVFQDTITLPSSPSPFSYWLMSVPRLDQYLPIYQLDGYIGSSKKVVPTPGS